jgi:hypothetical protein
MATVNLRKCSLEAPESVANNKEDKKGLTDLLFQRDCIFNFNEKTVIFLRRKRQREWFTAQSTACCGRHGGH